MKHLLILLISILLLSSFLTSFGKNGSSPVIGQSERPETIIVPVSSMGDVSDTGYWNKRNGKWGWYKSGNEKKDSKYVGEYKDGVRHGQGTYTQPNGEKYVGEYKDGKHHGQGTYIWGKGDFEGDR